MMEKKSYQSWTISDEFWETIKEDIPKTERDPKKKYVHAPGQGRKPMPARVFWQNGGTLTLFHPLVTAGEPELLAS